MDFTKYSRSIRVAISAATLVIAALPLGASAGVVFQSVTNLSDTTKLTSPWCSGCDNRYRIFDQFTLTNTESINGFSVSLFSPRAYWGSGLNFSIWTVGGSNLPDTELFSQTLSNSDFTTTAIQSNALIATTDKVTGLELDAGSYYVSFYNTNLGVWGYRGGGGNLYQQGYQFHEGTSAGFTLTGTENNVPEPASLALIGIALAGLGIVRRTDKQA